MDLKLGNKVQKKIKSKNESSSELTVYPKDSFDRFGDDLCEVLLSYHSISAKLRFECICKHWKSLIFNRQKKLIITEYSKRVLDKHLKQKLKEYEEFDEELDVIKIKDYLWLTNKTMILSHLFRKFKFITDLRIKCFRVDNKLLDQMIENFDRLKSIDISVAPIGLKVDNKLEIYERFGLKFGKTIKLIRIIGIEEKALELILKLCPNLETIYSTNCLKILSKHLFSKLRQIDCRKDIDFVTFADKYMTQIRKMSFNLFCFSDELPNNQFSRLVSQFLNLEELSLRFTRTEEFSANCLDLIANNCSKLRVLSINVCSLTFNRRLSENLSKLEFLKILELKLYEYVSDINDNYAIECTKRPKICSKVEYFTLSAIHLNDNDLNVMFNCFPNLKSFLLDCRYEGLGITDKTLDNLSKFKNLSTLSLKTYRYFPFITDSCVAKLIRNCVAIRNISIRYKLDSIETIEPMIEKANKNRKMFYKFDFYVESLQKYLENRKFVSIPKNLKLFAFHKSKRKDFICSTTQVWRLDNDYDNLKYFFSV